MGLFSKILKFVPIKCWFKVKKHRQNMLDLRFFTNFEWNERRKNPDVIETFLDFVCVLVAEGG